MAKKKQNSTHPMQPVEVDDDGVVRFKRNNIVRYLLDWCASKNGAAGYHENTSGPAPDLNHLATMNFSQEDWTQLAQLGGYSISGFGELSYVSDEDYSKANRALEATSAKAGSKVTRAHLLTLRAELVRWAKRAAWLVVWTVLLFPNPAPWQSSEMWK